MTDRFDSFVILAEMRTGSNLLETTLAQAAGVTCHGEVFNPAHLGSPKVKSVLGMNMAERIADPYALWHRIVMAPGLNGIRFFHDHEPRVLDTILNDPRCAKIVLIRNPVDCYVSLKIATATKKWRLGNVKDSVTRQIAFDETEFSDFLATRQAFQLRVLRALQVSGQTAFYVDYDAIQDVEVINGLLTFLGAEGRIERIADSLVRQNPEALDEKVRNYPEMAAALARVDWADLGRSPHFEPRRGAGIPRVVAAKGAPLLYFPMLPHEDAHIRIWLAQLGLGGLEEGFTQKTLRAWKRAAPGHRSFAVLRHPVPRALDAFWLVLSRESDADLRARLRKHYRVPIPDEEVIAQMDHAAFHAAFRAFLTFVKNNLAGQTGIATYPIWGTQWAQLEGISGFVPPDRLCREDRLQNDFHQLASALGVEMPDLAPPPLSRTPFTPDEICDREIELLARDVYRRDYVSFGFGDWR